jgi:ferredoxin-fold anticodon binding domain-containing protein
MNKLEELGRTVGSTIGVILIHRKKEGFGLKKIKLEISMLTKSGSKKIRIDTITLWHPGAKEIGGA